MIKQPPKMKGRLTMPKRQRIVTVEIDNLKLHFRCSRGCEEVATEIAELVKKHRNTVRRALRDMKTLLNVSLPEELDVVVTHRIKGPVAEGVVCAGKFHPRNAIVLNGEFFIKLEENCVDLETAHYNMMEIFLHELAHWVTWDDEEATEELAKEWLLSLEASDLSKR
jgi:hypothetical protein